MGFLSSPHTASDSSDKQTNKQFIDHVSLLSVRQTVCPKQSDKRRTTLVEHDSFPPLALSLSLFLLIPTASLSNTLLYLPHFFPSSLCPLFMNSPCLARQPMEKFLVCSLSQGQSLVRKPIELWSNSWLLPGSALSASLFLCIPLSLRPSH